MSAAKHTSGEWSVLEHDGRVFVLANRSLTVAEVSYQLLHAGVSGSTQLQNAHLMSSAPNLLAAAQRAIAEAVADDMDPWFVELQAAVAKATGVA